LNVLEDLTFVYFRKPRRVYYPPAAKWRHGNRWTFPGSIPGVALTIKTHRMKVLIAYSGGKDSQASLIWAVKNYGAKKIQAVFCDTGWENPVTYQHIKDTTAELGVELVTLKNEKFDGMIGLVEKRKRFPSTMARFCTQELKSFPMIDYILDDIKDNVLIIQGIRGDESPARSLMKNQCRQFKFYFEPYGKDKKGKLKFHTYRKKEIIAFCSKYSDDLLRPVFEWTGKQVIDYIIANGQKPNPLYYEGFKRVGCFPCIMVGHKEFLQIVNRYPERVDEISKVEERLGTTFFAPGYIPDKFTSTMTLDKKPIVTIRDAAKYLRSKTATLDMFDDDDAGPSCMSFYGLCE